VSGSSRAERRRVEQEARRAQRRRRSAEHEAAHAQGVPDLALLVPALAGAALAGYLTFVAWSGTTPVACPVGSGCDLVQGSRWGSFLGLPTAAWGLLAYLALTGVAVGVRSPGSRAALALAIAGPALAVSVYLTVISLGVIGAACSWCLASLALVAAAFAAALWRWRRAPRRPPAALWLGTVAAASLVGVAGLHLHYQGVFDPAAGPEDPRLRALAEHLDAIDARFYGASWCPHCQQQKQLFGASARRLPYVECSPEGPRAPQADACREAGIEGYPTWIIGGERHPGFLPLDELARLSGFRETAGPEGPAGSPGSG
jgi:uncharacterized membrane protein